MGFEMTKKENDSKIKDLQEQIKILKHINKENAALIKHDSTDELTSLLKKDAFFRETRKLLDTNPNSTFLFFRYDIDRFQSINALFGYDEGDRLLRYCADKIKTTKKSTKECTMGRVDADVFCICIKTESPTIEVDSFFNKTDPFLEGFRQDFRFNISVGIYEIENSEESLRDIYAKVTLAARKCKDSSTMHYFQYNKETDEEMIRQQIISSQMYRALKKEEFLLYFQPKVNLKTQKIVGAEALIRWNHPEKGLISPSKFIPIFYQNGFISQFDIYVFELVCKALKQWKKAKLKLIPISVNISQVSMMDADLPNKIFAIMKKHNVKKEFIHIEITEGAYSVDTEKSTQCAIEFSNRGIHLEMDDFGTGISSLTMLHELPVNTLKLDLRFIKNYSESKSNAGIIHFIVSLARQMQIDLVAEGIETENQLEFLRNIGCDIGQGYLFSKPVPEKDFRKLIANWSILEKDTTSFHDESLIDINDLWIPHSKFNILFNIMTGAAAVYEFTQDVSSVKVLKMNEEYLEVMEVEKSGKHHTFNDLLALFHPQDLAELQKNIGQTIQSQKSFNMLIRRINLPNRETPKWLKITIRNLFKNKTTSLILAILEDVSAQQERIDYLERETKIHEDYKKQLSIYSGTEQSGLASFQLKSKGLKLVYANDFFLSLHGCTREYAFMNADTILMETIHPDDKTIIIKALSNIINEKKAHFSWTMRIITLDGKHLETSVHGAVYYTEKHPFIDIIVRPIEKFESLRNLTKAK